MSNPFAVAAVTAAFSQMLGSVTEDSSLTGTVVTTRAPDAARPQTSTDRQLNLFLYGVNPNGAWRNMDLPERSSDGTLRTRPLLPLNLHYVVTSYGQNDDDLDAHHLLAYAMSIVHDQPVLTRDQIRAVLRSLAAQQPPSPIAQSDLADQIELVKICPHALTPDDLFKLWSSFQTHYRLSVAYEASVVLIERPHPVRVALPVKAVNVNVLTFRRPVITSVSPQVVTVNDTLTVDGYNLVADLVTVLVSGIAVAPASVSDTSISLPLPSGLLAGVNTVQITHDVRFGTPADPHRGFDSNVGVFMLAPSITNMPLPSPLVPISVARGSALTVAFTPAVTPSQQVSLLLGDRELTVPARAAGSAPVSTLDFTIPSDTPAGTSFVRLRVDGAESQLQVDTDVHSPTFNAYIWPQVTVT